MNGIEAGIVAGTGDQLVKSPVFGFNLPILSFGYDIFNLSFHFLDLFDGTLGDSLGRQGRHQFFNGHEGFGEVLYIF